MFDSVAIFLMTTLQISQDQILEGASDSYGQPPWITSFGFDILEDELPLELLQALGMTEQRQQEVQAALMTMFGDRRAAETLQGNVASTMVRSIVCFTSASHLLHICFRVFDSRISGFGVFGN